ncbi:hypothetical protein J6590_078382 [Homalodisca vitripennis]|nr:hypothetical protein J6590_078382 [Homalodisca vitripennis]
MCKSLSEDCYVRCGMAHSYLVNRLDKTVLKTYSTKYGLEAAKELKREEKVYVKDSGMTLSLDKCAGAKRATFDRISERAQSGRLSVNGFGRERTCGRGASGLGRSFKLSLKCNTYFYCDLGANKLCRARQVRRGIVGVVGIGKYGQHGSGIEGHAVL